MSNTLQQEGFVFLNSVFREDQILSLINEFEDLKSEKLENKDITQGSYDADQKRFEIMNPPLLNQLYRSTQLQDIIEEHIQEPLKVNNRCGYFCYHPGSFIKPHFDHILTDCMLLICLKRTFGNKVGGLLKLYIPEKILFDRKNQNIEDQSNCRIENLNLKAGESIFLAGGHVMHECTPVEDGGMRLVCGLGYSFKRKKD